MTATVGFIMIGFIIIGFIITLRIELRPLQSLELKRLTSSSSEGDCSWRWEIHKTGSLGWALSQHDWCS